MNNQYVVFRWMNNEREVVQMFDNLQDAQSFYQSNPDEYRVEQYDPELFAN